MAWLKKTQEKDVFFWNNFYGLKHKHLYNYVAKDSEL